MNTASRERRRRWERTRPACNEREARTRFQPRINADDAELKKKTLINTA
jgi:hypothetical protein